MSADCVFCRIVAGDAEASFVWRDAQTVAFMDLRQFSPGHTLVVPVKHVPDIFALDDETGAALMSTVTRVAAAVRAAVGAEGINIWQSNGEGAGQEVFHLHVHVLPRRTDDGLLRVYPSSPGHPSRAELDKQAEAVRGVLEAG
ncbi:MAG: HIT domain-containing protein [Dehalococcoidia bacterium]